MRHSPAAAAQVNAAEPHAAAVMVRKAIVQKEWAISCRKQAFAQHYETAAFHATRGYVAAYCRLRSYTLDSGLLGLMACRTGGILLARRAAKYATHQKIHDSYADSCPCCLANVQETLAHLFLRCTAWNAQRAAHLQVVIDKVNNGYTGLSDDEVVTVLLGGKLTARQNYSLGRAWLQRAANRPAYFLNVVRFLAAIKAPRFDCFITARTTPAPAAAAAAPAPAAAPASPFIASSTSSPSPSLSSSTFSFSSYSSSSVSSFGLFLSSDSTSAPSSPSSSSSSSSSSQSSLGPSLGTAALVGPFG